jgi:hypothetical protein
MERNMNNRSDRILKRNYYFTEDATSVTVTARPVHIVRPEKPVRGNKWAASRREIREACNRLTSEEISLYECIAASSWESR